MLSPVKCACGGHRSVTGAMIALGKVAVDCPRHGKALRKRSPDDWSAIMGATPPNQAEIIEKGGVTHVQ